MNGRRGVQVMAKVEAQLEAQLPEVQGAACLGLSALTGAGKVLCGILIILQRYPDFEKQAPPSCCRRSCRRTPPGPRACRPLASTSGLCGCEDYANLIFFDAFSSIINIITHIQIIEKALEGFRE